MTKHMKTLLFFNIYTKFLSRLITQEAHHLRQPPETKRIPVSNRYSNYSLVRHMEVISYPRLPRHD